jgi:putative endonuclease
VLYTGATNDLKRRIYEHRARLTPGFTSRYNVTRLAFYEETSDVRAAIAREKEIKAWRRAKKVALIDSVNPEWFDLAADWFDDEIPRRWAPRNDRRSYALALIDVLHYPQGRATRPARPEADAHRPAGPARRG